MEHIKEELAVSQKSWNNSNKEDLAKNWLLATGQAQVPSI
jgi:hypothetical protein